MKSRIVAATLAVAMGLWLHSAAYSQTEGEPPVSIAPQQSFDDFDASPQSGLPLGGLEVEPATGASGGSIPQSAELTTGTRDGEWLYALRRSVNAASWKKIALGSSGAFVVGALVWAAFVFRRRARRAYRRMLRTEGGSRPERLEELVASVQLIQSRSPGRHTLRNGMAGEEWPR